MLSPYKNVSDPRRRLPGVLLLTLAGAVILKGRLKDAGPLNDDEQAAVAAALIFVAAAPVALGVALALRDLCADRCSLRRRRFAGATTPPTAPAAASTKSRRSSATATGRSSPELSNDGRASPTMDAIAEASVATTAHPGEISYTVHANAARV